MRRPRTRVGRPRGSVDRLGRALPAPSIAVARRRSAAAVGFAIERQRVARDVSAEELALRLGLSCAAVYAWERGDRSPSVALLLRVATALGTSLAQLVADVE